MSFQLNLAPSQVVKIAKETKAAAGEDGEEEEGPQRKRREDYKKLKDLEEARKAGTAPAMKDEEGRDINPHIPQYIMQAPWYYNAEEATLRHQRMQPKDVKTYSKMGEWYKKGVKEGAVATKFRKGACENCGAITHVKKDCLEVCSLEILQDRNTAENVGEVRMIAQCSSKCKIRYSVPNVKRS